MAADPPQVDGRPIAVTLGAAVLSAELHLWPSARDAMDRCQELLDSARKVPAMAKIPRGRSTAVIQRPLMRCKGCRRRRRQHQPSGSDNRHLRISDKAKPAPFRLDVFLDQIAQGHTGPAIDNMPQIMQQLLPLLRLLNTNERAQVFHYLGGP